MNLKAYINPTTKEIFWVDAENKVYQHPAQLNGLQGSFWDWVKKAGNTVVNTAGQLIQTGQNGADIVANYPQYPYANTPAQQTQDPRVVVMQSPSNIPSWLLPVGVIGLIALVAINK